MEKPFLYKYQPQWLNDFGLDDDLNVLLKTLLDMDVLNILFIGDSGCGKTSLINAIIHEYYGTVNIVGNENILYINNLKEHGAETTPIFGNVLKIHIFLRLWSLLLVLIVLKCGPSLRRRFSRADHVRSSPRRRVSRADHVRPPRPS